MSRFSRFVPQTERMSGMQDNSVEQVANGGMSEDGSVHLLGSAEVVGADAVVPDETVTEPAKVMRIGSMIKQLLDEVHASALDSPSRERLGEIYERSIAELSTALSPDLAEELRKLALPLREGVVPTDAELRVAKAQLVGWLEGLFHGIQATLFAQQIAARQQLEQMRQLPGSGQSVGIERPGTYL
jgi:hypothetical protein